MLLPALSAAKEAGRKASCLNNLKQLQLAAKEYCEDNNGYLVANANNAISAASPYAQELWCSTQIEGWGNSPDNTNMALLESNVFRPYVNNFGIYKCPDDRVASTDGQRIRSYSMNGQDGGWIDTLEKINFNPTFKVFVKDSDIINSSGIFCFLDEAPDSINDGFLREDLTASDEAFQDVPASYHDGGCNFSFEDGHVEYIRWRTVWNGRYGLIRPVAYGLSYNGESAGPNNSDLAWEIAHASVPMQ